MEYFITGIDTEIGKTFVTKCLAYTSSTLGKKTGVYKPVQSGAIKREGKLLAPDIEAIKAVSNEINTKYSYLLEGEVSPSLAARLANVKIDVNKIVSDFKQFRAQNDVTLVEGAGGILAPVTEKLFCADLIKLLNIPIIIVSVPFLGRLNHTLLTVHYAKTNGIQIKGIIINRIPKETNDTATLNFIDELKLYTDVPILGEIQENSDFNKEEIVNKFKNII